MAGSTVHEQEFSSAYPEVHHSVSNRSHHSHGTHSRSCARSLQGDDLDEHMPHVNEAHAYERKAAWLMLQLTSFAKRLR